MQNIVGFLRYENCFTADLIVMHSNEMAVILAR